MNTYQRTERRIVGALAQSKLVAAKLALVLFVSACQPFLPMAEPPVEESADAPAYTVDGSHAMGDRSLVFNEVAEPTVHDPCQYLFTPTIVLFTVQHPHNSTPK